jgi:hypothetical protein
MSRLNCTVAAAAVLGAESLAAASGPSAARAAVAQAAHAKDTAVNQGVEEYRDVKRGRIDDFPDRAALWRAGMMSLELVSILISGCHCWLVQQCFLAVRTAGQASSGTH